MMRTLQALVFLFFAGLASPPLRAADPAIVDTAFVEAAITRGAILWDVRAPRAWRRGHLPGAVNIGVPTSVLRNDSDEDYIPLPKMAAILGEAGLDPAKEIVVYGDKASPANYFALETLRYLGARKAFLYHGGVEDWLAAGKSMTADMPAVRPVTLKLSADPSGFVSTGEVVEKARTHSAQFVDVRSPAEYRGEDIRAIRGGHIPGAVNIPYDENWEDPKARAKFVRREVKDLSGLDLKPADQLKALYAGLDPDRETVVYCQSGNRAAVTATVLKGIGFRNVKLYDSSWLGYAGKLSAPADNETFVNIGQMLSEMSDLSSRIDDLEEELAALKEGRR